MSSSKVITDLGTGGATQITLFLIGAVVWIVWQYRAHLRLMALGRQGFKFTPGWNVGWYLIPGANIVMPVAVVQDIWKASDPAAGAAEWKAVKASALVPAWWALFILGNFVSRVVTMIGLFAQEPDILPWADVLSAPFVLTAAVLGVLIVSRIETRISALEAAAGKPAEVSAPNILHAVGGGIVAFLAGAACWLVFSRALVVAGLRPDSWPLMAPAALAIGAGAGWLTTLVAGGRRAPARVAAGIAVVFAILGGTLLYFGPPPFRILVDFFTRPLVILSFFGRNLSSAFLWVMLLLAAGAAVGVTFISRKPGQPAPALAAPAAIPVTPPPPTPLPAKEFPPYPPPPPPAGMFPTTPPPPAPAVPVAAAVPVAPSVTAPVAPAPPVPALAPGAPATKPRSTTWLKVAIIALVAVMVPVALGTAGYLLYRKGAADSSAAPADTSPAPVVTPEQATWDDPKDVVRAMYTAIAEGNTAMLESTWGMGFDIDSGILAEWGDPSFEIAATAPGAQSGDVMVEIQETSPGGMSGDVVTWTVREQGSEGWKVWGWRLERIAEDPDLEAAPSPGDELIEANTVAGVVGTFLEARMVGDIAKMKQFTTARLERDQPGLFTYKPDQFTGFEGITSTRDGEKWVVNVRETWDGAPVTTTYIIVMQNRTYLLDEAR